MRKLAQNSGFTIPEVIVAAVLLTIICVGTLQTFVFATRVNRGNNLRMQAASVLQQEVEFYRSLKFVPGLQTAADLPNHRSDWIYGSATPYSRPQRTSADGTVFNLTVNVTNLSPSTDEHLVKYKRITITAAKANGESEGWLQSLNTAVTVERVRSN